MDKPAPADSVLHQMANSTDQMPPTLIVAVLKRPFSVEPYTRVMLMDGIFDTSVRYQLVTFFVTNLSATSHSAVRVYITAPLDPGIAFQTRIVTIPTLPLRASVKVEFLADFSNAKPGKSVLSITALGTGGAQTIFRHIFVSRTKYDSGAKAYLCEVPEGTLSVNVTRMIGPKEPPLGSEVPPMGPWLLTDFTASLWSPFMGDDGSLPFQDPLWKVVFGIIAVLSFLGSLLNNDGQSNNSAPVCDPDPATGETVCSAPVSLGQALFILAGAAAKMAFADRQDPWTRGRSATSQPSSERTLAEIVNARITYPQEIRAGAAYSVDVEWKYRRITATSYHEYAVSETVENEHVTGEVIVRAPARISLTETHLLNIDALIRNQAGRAYIGDELLLSAWLKAPNDKVVRVPLHDDGVVDLNPNDGWYSGQVDILQASQATGHVSATGTWTIYLLGQTVNAAKPGMSPMEAAAFIGGEPVVAPLALEFGGSSCTPGPSVNVEIVR